MGRPPSALWLAQKPVGATSRSLVEAFRAEHGGDFPLKVSHGGALDPFAEGLVVLLVGAANRLFEHLHGVPKTYRAEVVFGAETDTSDGGGQVVAGGSSAHLTPALLEEATGAFLGWTDQVPPNTSNKRVDGERAYLRAHRGEAFTLPAQAVYCHAARWVDFDLPVRARLELSVRGGFYVRALARDLGRQLGCGAHLAALERTSIGPWPCPAPGERVPLTGAAVLPWLPALQLTDDEWGRLRRGDPWPDRRPHPPEWALPEGFPPAPGCRAFHRERLVAVRGAGPPALLPGGV